MNRRGFLTLLGSVAATAVLDVDKLLWVPGKKTIFVPPPQRLLSLDEINQLTKKYIIPGLVDEVFRMNPLLASLSDVRTEFGGGAFIEESFRYVQRTDYSKALRKD